jgi:uncharacterized protein
MESSSETVPRSSGCDRVLVIMAKAPRPGVVKTRLASSLSPEAVSAFYCCLLDDTLALARSLGGVEVAIMCPETDVNELTRIAGNKTSVVAQNGAGLAAGLISVFAHFTDGQQQRRTIAFNSDSPHLPRSVLEDAFETLSAHDVVVGPTTEATISSARKLLILRFSQATEWAPAVPWTDFYPVHELFTFL